MTHRSAIIESALAFLKRGSLVRIQPRTPLLSQIRGVDRPPQCPPSGVERGVSGTKTVQGPNPYGGLSRGWREAFAPRVTGTPQPDSDDDILEPLRRVTCGGAS